MPAFSGCFPIEIDSDRRLPRPLENVKRQELVAASYSGTRIHHAVVAKDMTVVHSTRNCRNWCRWSNALWLAWNSDRLTIIPCTRQALKIFEPAFNVFHPPRRLLPLDQRATFAPLESDTSVEFHPINAQLQSKPSSRECYSIKTVIAAALTWVVYDVFLDLDREARSHFYTLFNSLKAHPQIVSVWSRYHTLLALGFFLMESTNLKGSCSSSSGLMLFMAGAAKTETVIGLVTTIISLLGGTKGLMGSTNILICGPGRVNVPDVNIASIYLGLVIHKTLDVVQDIEAMAGRPNPHSACFLKLFRTTVTHSAHVFTRYSLIFYFGLRCSTSKSGSCRIARTLRSARNASTRIFLNLKDLTAATHYGDVTWSEFQRNTALELQFRAGLATNDTRPSMYEMRPVRAPEDISGPNTAGVR
ncbi:hypothetical protein B0H14DRAFT_3128992 [Mycena olivaceomarginata]|nr:hypothetical protein B0H14DRAFT_3128992 [Mycena olivaceomarginata]